jgi:hypothetical protein
MAPVARDMAAPPASATETTPRMRPLASSACPALVVTAVAMRSIDAEVCSMLAACRVCGRQDRWRRRGSRWSRS